MDSFVVPEVFAGVSVAPVASVFAADVSGDEPSLAPFGVFDSAALAAAGALVASDLRESVV